MAKPPNDDENIFELFPTDCEGIRQFLQPLVDDELGSRSVQLVHSHIESCEECQELYKARLRLKKLLSHHASTINLDTRRPKKSWRCRAGFLGGAAFALGLAILVSIFYHLPEGNFGVRHPEQFASKSESGPDTQLAETVIDGNRLFIAGYSSEKGVGRLPDFDEAFSKYIEAAELGNTDAMSRLREMVRIRLDLSTSEPRYRLALSRVPFESVPTFIQVKEGDTLTALSEELHVSVKDLELWNRKFDSKLSIGELLYITKDTLSRASRVSARFNLAQHQVRERDPREAPGEILALYGMNMDDFMEYNDLESEASFSAGSRYLVTVSNELLTSLTGEKPDPISTRALMRRDSIASNERKMQSADLDQIVVADPTDKFVLTSDFSRGTPLDLSLASFE